jgi:hypothetical protein
VADDVKMGFHFMHCISFLEKQAIVCWVKLNVTTVGAEFNRKIGFMLKTGQTDMIDYIQDLPWIKMTWKQNIRKKESTRVNYM